MDGLHREELQALRPLPLREAAVLLVGHGSLLSPDSSRPVHQLATRLAGLGRFQEVRTAFWKEEPQLHSAFDLIGCDEVFVVPVLMGRGYFTDRVVPRELGLRGPVTRKGRRTVRYCSPVGSHPHMHRIVAERVAEEIPREAFRETTVVVLGHGTERHPDSAGTTLEVVDRLRAEGRFAHIVPAFLDQEPKLDRVLGKHSAESVIVVPFFVSAGWHVGTTVPQDLATPAGRNGGASSSVPVAFAGPVGTHPGLAEVVLDLIEKEAETHPWEEPEGERAGPPNESGFPAQRAKEWFVSWIRDASPAPRVLLQTAVWCVGSGGFEIRHERDRAEPPERLRVLKDPEDAREVASTTSGGEYRSLKTAPDLARGWRFTGLSAEELWEVYAQLYPIAPVHAYLRMHGELPLVGFPEAAARQTGLYERVGSLGPEQVGDLVEVCCGSERCLREPTWAGITEGTEEVGVVGCPAPCAVFLSEAARASGTEVP